MNTQIVPAMTAAAELAHQLMGVGQVGDLAIDDLLDQGLEGIVALVWIGSGHRGAPP